VEEPAAPVTNDFFTAAPQSFASAAAMVSDILAATPSETEVDPAADAPAIDPETGEVAEEKTDLPITPDFFTAKPKKKMPFRR